MPELNLVFPDLSHEKAWIEIIKEFKENGERPKPYGLHLRFGADDFKGFIERTKLNHIGADLENDKNKVQATTYFLLKDDSPEILGAIQIRRYLNDRLKDADGHIGYGVRPSRRNMGLATKMLQLALVKCKELNINQVLVTCNKKNIASAKVIEKNGGVYECDFIEGDGNAVARYWIDI